MGRASTTKLGLWVLLMECLGGIALFTYQGSRSNLKVTGFFYDMEHFIFFSKYDSHLSRDDFKCFDMVTFTTISYEWNELMIALFNS